VRGCATSSTRDYDDAEFTIELPFVMPDNVDDVEHFHSVLVGYVAGLHVHGKLSFVFAVTDS
jgi:hypothetical protein